MFDIVFWLLAVLTVSAALAVVILRDVFRAALSLILLFLTIAVLYITLYADFLAVVQILIYVGAISILIIVAVMLTREVWHGSPSGKLRIPALVVSLLLLGTMVFTVISTQWETSGEPPQQPTTAAIGTNLFSQGGFILPVEISAVLLLAAILGAIVLMREK
ncbi:MAG: NADH-quinone oxidoreductase subunit J [Dehalococcoidia bacterium]|nr:NADH-quinone oxidoreductase subunit J [Dehalococcoidia bacterium]